MPEINKITGIVAGQFGDAIQLVVVDEDGQPVDISGYNSTKTTALRSPHTLKTNSYATTFVTDGTNGQVQFTPATGEIDREGKWEGQIKLTSASATALTVVFQVIVEKKIVP